MNITSPWPKADMRWYHGVRCRKCRVPILFALDRSDGSGERPPSTGKLVLTCPLDQCKHQADYTSAAVSRFQKTGTDANKTEKVSKAHEGRPARRGRPPVKKAVGSS